MIIEIIIGAVSIAVFHYLFFNESALETIQGK